MYGLIGKKLSHSFSADFFNKKFEKEKIQNEYKLFELNSIEEFKDLIKANEGLEGLNVTIPYKEKILPYLDSLSEEAEAIGAVNVIKFIRKDNVLKLKGYNSDCVGFKNSLVPFLNKDIKKALILGTGGASKAVVYVLKNLSIEYTFVSRNPSINDLSYDELSEDIIKDNKLIVNTTPLGMFPNIMDFPSIPYKFLTSNHVCYDLVYNPEETQFLNKSKEYGAKVKNGLEMLYLQAIAAWDIWNK